MAEQEMAGETTGRGPATVVVIGAGPAGLTAAYEFMKRGAAAQVTMGSPRLRQLRAKMRAKLVPTRKRTPQACIAWGTCSRDDPAPKFAPTTRAVSPPSWSRRLGAMPSNR